MVTRVLRTKGEWSGEGSTLKTWDKGLRPGVRRGGLGAAECDAGARLGFGALVLHAGAKLPQDAGIYYI